MKDQYRAVRYCLDNISPSITSASLIQSYESEVEDWKEIKKNKQLIQCAITNITDSNFRISRITVTDSFRKNSSN